MPLPLRCRSTLLVSKTEQRDFVLSVSESGSSMEGYVRYPKIVFEDYQPKFLSQRVTQSLFVFYFSAYISIYTLSNPLFGDEKIELTQIPFCFICLSFGNLYWVFLEL